MKTLMYPIAPDDDFPEMFCAIRQGSGEHWFYTPVGEDASWMLFRAESENAKLRELVRDMRRFIGAACKKYPRLFDPSAQGGQMVYPNMLDSFEQRMRDLGVEVDG